MVERQHEHLHGLMGRPNKGVDVDQTDPFVGQDKKRHADAQVRRCGTAAGPRIQTETATQTDMETEMSRGRPILAHAGMGMAAWQAGWRLMKRAVQSPGH